jgi:ABC-type transport system involved in multi-copper enzyme maturation permease subunit
MFAIAEVTYSKLKEPAFLMMMAIAALIGYGYSEMDSLGSQLSGGIVSQLFNTQKEGYAILTSSAISFFLSMLLAIFIGATEIPRDIESGAILIFLTKPLRKSHYLFGKYFGILSICGSFFIISECSVFISHYIKTGEMYPTMLMARQLFLILALMPIVAFTISVSCFFQDLSAMILCSVYLLIAASISYIPLVLELIPKSLGINTYIYVLYYMFPNLIYFFQSFHLDSAIAIGILLYTTSMTAIFLAIADYHLHSRDLT